MRIHQLMMEQQQNMQMLRMPSNPNIAAQQARPRWLEDSASFTELLNDAEDIEAIVKDGDSDDQNEQESRKGQRPRFRPDHENSSLPKLVDEAQAALGNTTTGTLINITA